MDANRSYKISLLISVVALVAIITALVGMSLGWWSQKRDFTKGNEVYLAQQRGLSGDFQNVQGTLLIGPYKDLRRQRYSFFDESLLADIGKNPSFSFWLYNFTYEDAKRWMQEWGSKGVSVQGIIENKQYGQDGSQFAGLQDIFRDNPSVHIIGDDRLGVNYQHAKAFLASDRFVIQTANMTYTSFNRNKEIFFLSADRGVLQSLKTLFQNDWSGISTSTDALHPNLVVCPTNCRDRVETLLESAQSSIYMYQQYIQDSDIQDILVAKKKQGVDIRLILGNDPNQVAANLEEGVEPEYRSTTMQTITNPRAVNNYVFDAAQGRRKTSASISEKQFLQELSGDIHIQTSPYVHAKAILVDGQFLLIGSMNISANSLDKNREIGILLIEEDIITKFQNAFLKDWSKQLEKKQ